MVIYKGKEMDWTDTHDFWFRGLVDLEVLTRENLCAPDTDTLIRRLQKEHQNVLGPRFLGEDNVHKLMHTLRKAYLNMDEEDKEAGPTILSSQVNTIRNDNTNNIAGDKTTIDSLQTALKDMEAKLKAEVAAHNTTKKELAEEVKQHKATKESLANCEREKFDINGQNQQLQQESHSRLAEISTLQQKLKAPFQKYDQPHESYIFPMYQLFTERPHETKGFLYPVGDCHPLILAGFFQLNCFDNTGQKYDSKNIFMTLVSTGSDVTDNILWVHEEQHDSTGVYGLQRKCVVKIPLASIRSVKYSYNGPPYYLIIDAHSAGNFHIKQYEFESVFGSGMDVFRDWKTVIDFLKVKINNVGLRC